MPASAVGITSGEAGQPVPDHSDDQRGEQQAAGGGLGSCTGDDPSEQCCRSYSPPAIEPRPAAIPVNGAVN